MNPNTRIKLDDSVFDIVMKLSEGIPGALRVCSDVIMGSGKIDQAGALGGFGTLLMFDSLGLYGSSIWLLYKELCGESLEKTIAVPRAWQLGFVTYDQVQNAIKSVEKCGGSDLNVEELLTKVKERLGPEGWVSPSQS